TGLDLEQNRLVMERVSQEEAAISLPASNGPEVTGPKQFRIEPATRIWIGDRIGRLEDLAVGQIVQANFFWTTVLGTTYQKAVTETADEAICRDIWIDRESRSVATEQQRQI